MKKPRQTESVRGNNDSPNVSHKTHINNIPLSVINELKNEMQGISFGSVSLIISFRDTLPAFRIEKTKSIMITGR
ncbi:MAG: hypothetical protein FWG77_10780 [Treponema sp.]|nr:hypothetical protein [Treponema sp.]